MTKFINFLKYELKHSYKFDFFVFLQSLILFIILIAIFSNKTIMANYKKYGMNKYDNITVCRLTDEEMENYKLCNKKTLGTMVKTGYLLENSNQYSTIFADKFIFNNFKIPIIEGYYPNKKGEAIANIADKQYLKLGNNYNVYIDNNGIIEKFNIKIVGYAEISYTTNTGIVGTFSRQYQDLHINILWDDVQKLNFTEDKFNTKKYLEIGKKETLNLINKYSELNSSNLINIGLSFEEFYNTNQPVMIFYTYNLYLVIILFIIFNLINFVIEKFNNEKKNAIYFIYGQSVFSILLCKISKYLLNFILIALITLLFTYIMPKTNVFSMNFKGWTMGFICIASLMIVFTLIDFVKIKKQKIIEIINI